MPPRKQVHTRTFSVPAGTTLPDGTRLDAGYRVTLTHSGSPGAAQKAARRQVAEQIRADHPGAKFTLTQLQASTARVNKPTGKARGGRNPKFTEKERYGGQVKHFEVPPPSKPTPSAWRARILRVLRKAAKDGRPHYFGLAAYGKPNPRGHYGPSAPTQWVQTQSFAGVAEFQQLAPNGGELLDWLGLANIEQATIVQVFPESAE